MYKPWMSSADLIESVSRKIAIPISQNSFSHDDILSFATEEMFISQVPAILTFHEEYFVWTKEVPLVSGRNKYPIPDRAIGMKIRDLFYKDSSGNLFEMCRISEEDKALFQRYDGGNTYHQIAKYYLEANNIILSNNDVVSPTGSLLFSFYLRPNVLVPNERAAIITNFTKTITVNKAAMVAGDKITINGTDFVSVAGSPTGNQFQIGIDSLTTAASLASAITLSGVVMSASVGSPATSLVTVGYTELSTTLFTATQTGTGLTIQAGQGIQFSSIPSVIVSSSTVDILQTKSGHSTREYGIVLSSNAVGGNIINFGPSDVPNTVVVGDYVCLENECIIPQIPTDLHSGLAERTCARILASLGDQQGLAASNAKIQEIDQRQSALLSNRVEGSPIKVRARNSLLSLGKRNFRP
jgi:hypothetical protein